MSEMLAVRPIELVRLTPTQARLGRQLACQQPVLTFPEGHASFELRLAPASDAPLVETPPGVWLRSGAAFLQLHADQDLLDHWLRPWIGELTLDRLPPALGAAARQAALSPLLDALESLMSIRFEPMDRVPAQPAIDIVLGLWRMDCATGAPVARLYLNSDASAQLAHALDTRPTPSDGPEPWPTLPLPLTPWLGASRLSLRQLQTLEVGDLFLLARRVDADAISVQVRQGTRVLAVAHITASRLIVDRLVTVMSEPPAPDPALAPPVLDADDLEIGVDFALGSLQVPLRDLRTIRPGYCFELTGLDRPYIRLVVGGRLIGQGELVMIENHLGVRVTEIFQSPPAA